MKQTFSEAQHQTFMQTLGIQKSPSEIEQKYIQTAQKYMKYIWRYTNMYNKTHETILEIRTNT